jgi:Ni/Fe-hydrogenase subunit HybB-like protein
MSRIKSFRITPWIIWCCVLGLMLFIGLVAGILVFWKGLWITNLTDLIPWGLWIAIDLSAIALSAGAFMLCAGVYLLGLKRYQPLARTATFIGLTGYTTAMLALLLDIGRPDRFWHSLIYWNVHSPLWEVTMCVMLYLTVLVLESLPIFASYEPLDRRFPRLTQAMRRTHHFAPVLAICGLGLSMLHQSSLGAIYGVLIAHPLWFRPDVAVLFIVSAIVGGTSLTVFVSMLAARLTRRAVVDDRMLQSVSIFIGWALVVYLYSRAWDTFAMTYTYQPGRTEGLHLLTSGPLAFNFWVMELLLGAVVPIVLLLNPRTRANPILRMIAVACVAIGVVAYRWDTNLSGLMVVLSYLPGQATVYYASYRPSLVEIGAALGLVGYALMMLSVGVRYLKVVDHTSALAEEEVPEARAIPQVAPQAATTD